MTLVYQAIHAALVPIALHELPGALDAFLEHIGRRNEKTRPKQTSLLQPLLEPRPSTAGTIRYKARAVPA